MKTEHKLSLPRSGAVLALALFLSACAGSSVKTESISDRAQARWDALLAGEFERAYALLSPGYRSSVPLRNFEMSFLLRRVQYDSANYLDHQCEADACTVRIRTGYTIMMPMRGVQTWKSKAVIEEKWVRVNDQWWFLPEI
jgi:hypothetical protein